MAAKPLVPLIWSVGVALTPLQADAKIVPEKVVPFVENVWPEPTEVGIEYHVRTRTLV